MKYLLLLLLLFSCAFKKAEPAQNIEPSKGNQTITVSWKGDRDYSVKRYLIKSGDGYSASADITLSTPIPTSLEITGLPLSDIVYVDSVEALEDGQRYALASSMKSGAIELSGLRTILTDDKEQKVTLLLRGRDARTGATPWVLRLSLITLPVSLEISELPVSSFPAAKRLLAPNLRLDLLKTIRIKNTKLLPIEILFATAIQGHLRRYFDNYGVKRGECSTEYLTSRSSENYPLDLYLIPLDEKMAQVWTASLSSKQSTYQILPGKELVLGVFGAGKIIQSFLDGGPPPVHTHEIEVPSSCHLDCATLVSFRDGDPHEPHHCSKGVITGKAREGSEGKEVNIIFDSDSNFLSVRYSLTEIKDDPASKILKFSSTELPLL
jgi:hypothetical protein